MADSTSNNPCAIKIVDVTDGRLSLDVATLRQILLQKNFENKRVCIISIAGAFRQGKSFLLNFFIRYLNVTGDERADLKHWLDPELGPITGFLAKGGYNAVTTGIWIWSHIFLRKLSSGEEIAIILMDTQGAFDNQSSDKDSAVFFALSTLISSVQIYNLKDNINNLNWDCLEYFLNYAELLRETVNQKPFQNLLFLIRDWPDETDHLFGTFGGNQYLNKMINTRMGNRNRIYNLFNQINCFLLPDPGLEVRKKPYEGEVDKIEPKFKEYVEKLSSSILTSDNLTPKVLNGEPIKVRHLVDLFENYCKEFSKEDMPEGQTLFEANAKVQHIVAIEEAETVYENQMKRLENQSGIIEEEMLLQIHESSKAIAVSNLNNKILLGGDKMKRDSVAQLSNKIHEKFNRISEYLRKIKTLYEEKARMEQKFEEQLEKISHLEKDVSEVLNEREKIMEEYQKSLREHDAKITEVTNELRDKHGSGWTNIVLTIAIVGIGLLKASRPLLEIALRR